MIISIILTNVLLMMTLVKCNPLDGGELELEAFNHFYPHEDSAGSMGTPNEMEALLNPYIDDPDLPSWGKGQGAPIPQMLLRLNRLNLLPLNEVKTATGGKQEEKAYPERENSDLVGLLSKRRLRTPSSSGKIMSSFVVPPYPERGPTILGRGLQRRSNRRPTACSFGTFGLVCWNASLRKNRVIGDLNTSPQ